MKNNRYHFKLSRKRYDQNPAVHRMPREKNSRASGGLEGDN